MLLTSSHLLLTFLQFSGHDTLIKVNISMCEWLTYFTFITNPLIGNTTQSLHATHKSG